MQAVLQQRQTLHSAPYTGDEYLRSLRDGREIYIYGERVGDVTRHPAFRNAAVSIAKLYDALHDPARRDRLTTKTDTGSGGFTHRFFRVARSREDLLAQRDAIADWSRLTYGWMGRTPDYKASFTNTLGVNAAFYGDFADNARAWYRRAQETVPFINHALVNPPVDRNKAADQVKDVFIHVTKETDAGIRVTGAKVVATSSAITHYNFLGQNFSAEISDPSFAVMFMAPMDSPGVKLICRPSYELAAAAIGSPFDYPLASRFDENDAIFVFDDVFVPWENVFVYRNIELLKTFYTKSGFLNGYTLHGCTRLAVKLDFLIGLTQLALRASGTDDFRGVQVLVGEMVGWRNLFWSLSEAMASSPDPWMGDAVLPNLTASTSYRILATEAYPAVRGIIEKIVASGLIYLPSSARDFQNPDIDRYLARFVRGSNGIDYRMRIKIMKALWDAIGSEFGGRHELYERNYAGNHEAIRLQALMEAKSSGKMSAMEALALRCLDDYDENGWRDPAYHASTDISLFPPLAGAAE